MIAAWILYSLLAGVLIAGAAYALAAGARAVSLPTRWIWGVALVASVALAASAPLRARVSSGVGVNLPTATTTTAAAPIAKVAHLSDRIAAATTALSRGTVSALASVAGIAEGAPARWLVIAWIALSAGALVLLLTVHARFGRLRRGWPLADVGGANVRVAPDVGPAVIGVARPEIVVPTWLLQRTAREQALVVAHEAEHVRGRDPALLGAAWLLVALVPWNLAAWWMLSRLRLAVELDCDARVLRRGVAPRAYGSLLIDLAGRCAGFPAGAPALADTPSHLERRLVAMRPDRPRFPLVRAVGAGALALVAVLAACEAKMPTQDDVTSMDAASAERVASALQMEKFKADSEQATKTMYIVDDKRVTAKEAREIAADRIATVNITKAQTPDGVGIINIHTKSGGVDTVRFKVSASAEQAEKLARERHAQGYREIPDGGDRMARSSQEKKFAGLIYIDGVLAGDGALSRLNPKDIATVNVLKGEAARAQYGDPAAANGVIQITTVHAAKK